MQNTGDGTSCGAIHYYYGIRAEQFNEPPRRRKSRRTLYAVI